jgi:hypothetical protein
MDIQLIKAPTGVYVAVGFKIPMDLAYRNVNGENLTDEEARKLNIAGPGFCTSWTQKVTWESLTAATDDIIARYPEAAIKADRQLQADRRAS